jgi:dihydrofolate reductase
MCYFRRGFEARRDRQEVSGKVSKIFTREAGVAVREVKEEEEGVVVVGGASLFRAVGRCGGRWLRVEVGRRN